MSLHARFALALPVVFIAACSVAQGGGSGDGNTGSSTSSKMPPPPSGEVRDEEPDVKPWSSLPNGSDLFRNLPKADFKPAFGDGGGGATTDGASLQSFDTPVKNQGSRGWCTAFAQVAAIENLVRHGFGEIVDLSEIDHWSHYQQYSIEASLDAAQKYLITPETSWPYYGSPISGYESTGIAKVTTAKSLTSRSQVFDAIKAGHPVIIGADLTDSWQNPTSKGVVDKNGYIIGAHAILVVGYQNDGSYGGGGYLLIKNSWGSKWGDLGYARMPYDYCQTQDCYFIEVSGVQYNGKSPDPSPAPAPDPSPDAGPTPAPDPTPTPTADPTAWDIDVAAEHDAASPDRFKLHLVERKAGALSAVQAVTYDVHETFGAYEYWTVDQPDDGYAIPFYYRTYSHYWKTNGAAVRLKSGKILYLDGAIVSW